MAAVGTMAAEVQVDGGGGGGGEGEYEGEAAMRGAPLVAPPLSRRALLSPLAPSPCVPRRPPPSSCCCTNPAHGLKNHWASAMGE